MSFCISLSCTSHPNFHHFHKLMNNYLFSTMCSQTETSRDKPFSLKYLIYYQKFITFFIFWLSSSYHRQRTNTINRWWDRKQKERIFFFSFCVRLKKKFLFYRAIAHKFYFTIFFSSFSFYLWLFYYLFYVFALWHNSNRWHEMKEFSVCDIFMLELDMLCNSWWS